MKIYKNRMGKIGLVLSLTLFFMSCTKNFEDINTNPNQPDDPDGSFRLATLQVYSFGEPRYVTWRGNVIFSSQFANHYIYNFKEMAWFPGKTYTLNAGWTDAVWQSSYLKVGSNLHTLLDYIDRKGNEADRAVVRIIGSWFYQKMTDFFGDIPYSEVFRPTQEIEIIPKFDRQKDIYTGIIEDLTAQIAILKKTDISIAGDGDFLYGGDQDKWIAFANTLKLRLAIRARDAYNKSGNESFVDDAIEEALKEDLIDGTNQAIFLRAQSGLFLNDPNNLMGGQEDVWHTFAFNQSQWVLNEEVVALMRDNNDPRLTVLCTKPDSSDTYKGTQPNYNADNIESWYQLSKPSAALVGTSTSDPVPANIITAAESYFLQAEAAVLGYGGGNAEELYQMGIKAHMELYKVEEASINDFLANEGVAKLDGNEEQNLEKIWRQRWLSHLNNGYEAWALARRTDIIADQDMGSGKYLANDSDGEVPSRMVYPGSEQTLNAANINDAIGKLDGGDVLTSKIWWDVK